MADPRSLYNFKPVAKADTTFLFPRESRDRRPLLQDLPLPIESLPRLIKWVLQKMEEFPESTAEDFSEGGDMFPDLLDKIEELNESTYNNMRIGSVEPDMQTGFFELVLYRGFQKSKQEIDRFFEQQKLDSENAQKKREKQAVAEGKAHMRAVGAMEKMGALPDAPAFNVPGAPRSPVPVYIPKRRSPPKARQIKGGDSSASVLSAGACSSASMESSLTRLLESVGSYDATSELWTVRVDSLSNLFPKTLRDRELRVTVEDLSGGSDMVTAEFHLDVPSSIEPDVHVLDST
jgi:hypothetical protein